jgi:hypothetical protein
MSLRPPGEPPVKSGEIDEHQNVRPGVEKAPFGPPREFHEAVQAHDHPQEPHHRQRRQVGQQPAAGGLHPGPAEADALDRRVEPPQFPHQSRRMVVARGLAGRKEDAHEKLRPGGSSRTEYA